MCTRVTNSDTPDVWKSRIVRIPASAFTAGLAAIDVKTLATENSPFNPGKDRWYLTACSVPETVEDGMQVSLENNSGDTLSTFPPGMTGGVNFDLGQKWSGKLGLRQVDTTETAGNVYLHFKSLRNQKDDVNNFPTPCEE